MKSLREIVSLSRIKTLSDYFSLSKKIDQMYGCGEISADKELNIAILSSSTTNGVKEVLHAQCGRLNIFGKFYIGEYNQYAQEIFNTESKLYASQPDFIIINVDFRSISGDQFFTPYVMSDSDRITWVNGVLELFSNLVNEIVKRTSAKVLLHNFEVPIYTSRGLIENKEKYGFIESIEDINIKLRKKIKESDQIFLFDYEAFCSKIGKSNTFDYKMYYMGDIKLKPQLIPKLCEEYARYISALTSHPKKCIVLDLDNTLWGGVVGESGIDGIQLGPTPEGRPYLEFQRYLKSLSLDGVILAVNSKNNFNDAMDVIQNHPYMILKEDVFSSVRINWDDKVSNLRSIAGEINIGLDSVVFFDDDPINRDMVKKFLPEVTVVDLPIDPSLYVKSLIELNCFDKLSITNEDKKKSSILLEQKERKKLSESTTDLTEYLKMLKMSISIKNANKSTVSRIAQLTQKTNQFNLTTKRYTEEGIKKLMISPNSSVISLSLIDKFGDNGLTGVAIIQKNIDNWKIESFLLSCRILGRGVEKSFLSYIIKEAQREGISFLYGDFISSKKNIITKNFYRDNNFTMVKKCNNCESWKYNLSKKCSFPKYIKLTTI